MQPRKPNHTWFLGLGLLVLLTACAQQDIDSNKPEETQSAALTTPAADAEVAAQQAPAVLAEQHRKLPEKIRQKTGIQLFSAAKLHHPGIVRTITQDVQERYPDFENNGVFWTAQDPVSTFAVDVDSAAYANMRRQLQLGRLPNPDSVRVEELINYFSYDYPAPTDREQPFSVYTEMGPSPWDGGEVGSDRKLVHIGIKGWADDQQNLPPANLVFLIDTSGSMQAANKLGLFKSAAKMLVNQLRPQDRVAIVVYAGSAGQVLAPTSGAQRATIMHAIDNLRAGGSTNGSAGIDLAYQLARQNFQEAATNRVILATDGDFNVGTTDIEALKRKVEQERASGVALTVLGFGTGNYNDHLMQELAQIGNGNAAYIDTITEARKVLVEELGATLHIIAKDMKVQVEFNPQVVETYRLIGYETRHLNREDFSNDRVDAGDVGAGHTVTALYEVTLTGDGDADSLRYTHAQSAAQTTAFDGEVAFIKLRYKQPDESRSRLVSQPLYRADMQDQLHNTSKIFRFSSAVAWLGQALRKNAQVPQADLTPLIELAQGARGDDPHGYRHEFLSLARTAQALQTPLANVTDPRRSEHSSDVRRVTKAGGR